MKIPIIVITGATASGKTALSIEIAKKFGGEIVSADSMQIYKYMDIGTAKPTEQEKGGVVHHLIDFLSPFDEYSVADYVRDAHECIDDIAKRDKLPILVGGTGLYINSLINDISFDEICGDEKIRNRLLKTAQKCGGERLLQMLSEFDPKSAKNLHPNNIRRIIRAIEYYEVTGRTISEHNDETKKKESRYNPCMFAIEWERQKLYERIDKRVDIMLDNGLLNEVCRLAKMGCTKKMQSMQGIGYKQMLDFYRGFSTMAEATRIIKRDSRRYAKRQLTWFRRDNRINWLNAYDGDVIKQAGKCVAKFLAENR